MCRLFWDCGFVGFACVAGVVLVIVFVLCFVLVVTVVLLYFALIILYGFIAQLFGFAAGGCVLYWFVVFVVVVMCS